MKRAAIVACCIGMSWSLPAHAEPGPSIVVKAEHHAELGRRLRAEAGQAGMHVLEAPDDVEASSVFRSTGAVATLHVVSASAIEVFIQSDRGEPVSETWQRRPGEGDAFPLRVIEGVRARLVELELWPDERSVPSAEPGPSREPESPRPVEQDQADPRRIDTERAEMPAVLDAGATSSAPENRSSGMWVVGGAGAAIPSGGMGTTPNAWLGARFDWKRPLGAEFLTLLPLNDTEVSEPEGEADVGVTAFVAHLDYAPSLSRVVSLRVGAGGGLLVLRLRGEAEPGFVAGDDTLFSGLAYGEIGAAFGLGSWMRVSASALFGISAPRPVLRFDERDVAAWGRSFVAAAVRAELRLAPWVVAEP